MPFHSNSRPCNVHSSRAVYRELHEMGHLIETQCGTNYCELPYFKEINLKSVYIYTPKCCTLTMHGSHTLLQIPSCLTQFLTQNHQNSTRKSLHMSYNMVYSQICHKYIHVMGGKDQTSKGIATCENFVSPRICCEEAAAGMLRAFPVHFVSLQSNSTHCNMHGSHAATECGISYETDCWKNYSHLFSHF